MAFSIIKYESFENFWTYIYQQLFESKTISNVKSKTMFVEVWNNLSVSLCLKLINSMQKLEYVLIVWEIILNILSYIFIDIFSNFLWENIILKHHTLISYRKFQKSLGDISYGKIEFPIGNLV